jgi:uncharacterized protein
MSINEKMLTSTYDYHFHAMIADLLADEKVNQLDLYNQHLNTSRLQHSINVAYLSYQFTKNRNVNVLDTVRAALLHDFFLYEWRSEQPVKGNHISIHPQQALLTAKTITEVTPLMEDIILSHMWPVGRTKPKSKEAWIVSIADKISTMVELSTQLLSKSKKLVYSPIMISLLFFMS